MFRYKSFIAIAFILGNYQLFSQELPGLSYCLLFDSKLEKEAFQKSNSKEIDPLLFLLAYDLGIDSAQYHELKSELSNYAAKLLQKREKFKNESKFLRAVFYKVYSKYLINYKASGTFNGIFKYGNYNCASGTALYAYLLDQLGYSPKIFKTRYHTFLIIKLPNSTEILFETTDFSNGFVDDKEEISKRINGYLADEREKLAKQATLSAPFNNEIPLEPITLKELAGLHYYNLAIDLMNEENNYDAFRMLKKARILYPKSDCIGDFLQFSYLKYESELSNAFSNK